MRNRTPEPTIESIEEKAYRDTVKIFIKAYENLLCHACGEPKWINSPFCRSCSIKLQRKNLMYQFVACAPVGTWRKWHEDWLRQYFTHWDLCLDLLMDMKRIGKAPRPLEDEPDA